jgi:hypothetical protein
MQAKAGKVKIGGPNGDAAQLEDPPVRIPVCVSVGVQRRNAKSSTATPEGGIRGERAEVS